MYRTYILESLRTRKYYIGHTNNLKQRFIDHNRGKDHSSKCGKPWHLVYSKSFETRSEAVRHERYLKSLKNKKYLKKLINNNAGWSSGSSPGP